DLNATAGRPANSLDSGAGGGGRTHTRGEPNGILSPARLPVSPLRHSSSCARALYRASLRRAIEPATNRTTTPVNEGGRCRLRMRLAIQQLQLAPRLRPGRNHDVQLVEADVRERGVEI